ncbi:hypothetical protein AKJ50_02295, partial [candidate division MSBL1 archaeon SCGC-AAA382A13]
KEKTLSNIETTTDQDKGVSNADLVIEAAPEKMELKKEIFSAVDKASPKGAILSSNTSSLSIGEMAEATNRGEKFAGLHFFNPPVRMPLVEIIRHEGTSDETAETCVDYAESLDKTPVICRKDVPGFIVNRILGPVINEAAWTLYREEASIEEVDAAAKFKAGLPMGLFELADFTGLDINKEVAKVLYEGYGERMKPAPVIDNLVEEGKLGKKSGEGFYDSWPDRPSISLMKAEEWDYKRIYAMAANESAYIVQEDVADPEDIDTAIEYGLGWGEGPCKLADKEGIENIVEKLENLYEEHGDERYKPCPLLKKYAEEGRGFYE